MHLSDESWVMGADAFGTFDSCAILKKMFNANVLIVSIKFLCLGVFASSAASAQSNGVEYFRNEFPKIVCMEDDYLMSCFRIKKSVCEFTVKELVESCLEKVPGKAEARSKHIALGACIGDLFEKKHLSLKQDTPRCVHPEEWK